MNDQRQVIFSQRLKILKEDNINDILKDFLSEKLSELENLINDYKKSNNDKHLTEIKNTTGSSILDEELIKLASDKNSFKKYIRDLFLKKQKLRIDMIGENQNKILEKKIFLQIIDFSWRSHLQYLEQLRQVIGLRQYGQKDPLSEFKKEAFILFESLLAKIKNDLIKLLLNLNLVVSSKNEKEENKNINKDKKIFKSW